MTVFEVKTPLVTTLKRFTIAKIDSVSSPPVSWCVVGVLAQYGCRRIIHVDAIGGG